MMVAFFLSFILEGNGWVEIAGWMWCICVCVCEVYII